MTVTITEVGPGGIIGGVSGISSGGIVAGTRISSGGPSLGYEEQNGVVTYLSDAAFTVTRISPDGQWIAGYDYLNPYGSAAYWHDGAITQVGPLTEAPSTLYAINDKGDVAGTVTLSDGNESAFFQAHGGNLVILGALNGAAASNGGYSTATGINDAGQVVGYSVFSSSETTQQAFLWQNGVMTDLGSLVPGGYSIAEAINQAGDIVGSSSGFGYSDEAVLWSKGTMTALPDVPGLSNAIASGINDQDQIVGTALTASGIQHALLWQNGTVTDLNDLLPADSGWVLTGAWSINDSGEIVGSGIHDGVQTSFELSLDAAAAILPALQSFRGGTLLSAVALEAASPDVLANLDGLEAMDKAGRLLSIALTDGGVPVLTLGAAQAAADADALAAIKGSFSLAIRAGDSNETISGLAGHDAIVLFDSPAADYQVSRTADGFAVTGSGGAVYQLHDIGAIQFGDGIQILAEPAGGRATLAGLDDLSGYGNATPLSIDAQGDVAGNDYITAFADHVDGVLWSNGKPILLQTLLGQNQYSGNANGISSDGWIAGQSHVGQGTLTVNTPSGPPQAVLWELSANGYGDPVTLGYLPGDTSSIATDVNSRHQAVGVSYITGADLHAFLWQNGAMTALGSLGGTGTLPIFIDDQGRVVGYSDTVSGIQHAFLWRNGTMTDLGALTEGGTSAALSIDKAGEVVGYALDGSGISHAVSWMDGRIARLDGPAAGASAANSINDQGVIAGASGGHAVIWANDLMIDLNSLLPADSGWSLISANAINDAGEIAGTGTFDGVAAAFELTLPSVLPLTAAALAADLQTGSAAAPVTVTDSAAGVSANLDGLQKLAAAGGLSGITLTDTGAATLSVSAAQLSADQGAIGKIAGAFTLAITAPAGDVTLSGLAGHGNILVETGNAARYSVTASGTGFVLAGPDGTATLDNIQAIQFADHEAIVAAAPGAGTTTTGNITELYGAAFGRIPDVAGLGFYQAQLAADPGTPLTRDAVYFLSSPEYTANPAHDYAQTAAGDTQFITDLYQNLLNRAPQNGDVPFYLKVIDGFTQGLAAGTASYAAAELQAHAAVLTYFSQSAEFLGDVSVTASHPADGQHWLILV